MFGLRYDAVETPIAPPTNVNFVKEYGFSNSSKFDFDVLQPRFSFNMDVTDLFASREKVVAATFRGGRACSWVEFQEFGMVMHTPERELLETTGVGSVIVLVTLAFQTAQVICLKEIQLPFG